MFRRILVLFALLAVVAAMVPTEAGQQYARIINAMEYKNQEQARLLNNARGLLDGLLGGGGILGGII